MKWSIVGLFALGVIASVSAFFLVVALQNREDARGSSTSPGTARTTSPTADVTVLVAARDLESRTVLGGDGVVSRTIASDQAPPSYFSDPVQVVGKILIVPLKQGQLFEPSSFASEGSGLRLSSALTAGKRIVSVALDDSMGIEPLLYPGSIVDVLASFKVKSDDGTEDRALSVTLLQGVMVLAVGTRTVVSDQPDRSSGMIASGGRPTVSLLVEPPQAEVLKLAMEAGSISLSMRNPMDAESVDAGGMRLATLSPILAEIEARRRERERVEERNKEEQRDRERTRQNFELEKARYEAEKSRQEFEVARMRIEKERLDAERALAAAREQRPENKWETTILRGGKAETRTFALGSSSGGGR